MITKNVTLHRGDAGFGFSVIGGSDTYLPPMIFTLAPGQPADTSQQVLLYSNHGYHAIVIAW